MVLSEFFIYFVLFFRREGFRMITFDRQAGPLQNFNRSHIMVIGRSVLFSDPRVGAWGAPNTPKSPPPPEKKFSREKNLRNFWPPPSKKKFGPPPPNFFIFFCVLRPHEHFLAKFFFQLKIPSYPPPPPPPARPRPVLRTLAPILVQ